MPSKFTEIQQAHPATTPVGAVPMTMAGAPMPSSVPALTMSLLGVDFSLTPCTLDSSVTFHRLGSNREVFLNLNNFTGSLRVAMSAPPPVVEESPSPPAKQHHFVPSPMYVPGQQQLNFHNSTQKRGRPKKKNNVKTKKSKEITDQHDIKTPIVSNASKKTTFEQDLSRKRGLPLDQQESTKKNRQLPPSNSSPMPAQTQRYLEASQETLGFTQRSNSQMDTESVDDQGNGNSEINDILDKAPNQSSMIKNILNRMGTTGSQPAVEHDSEASDSEMDDDGTEEGSEVGNENGLITQKPESAPKLHPPPCPRWGHTMNMLKNNKIIVYGGQTVENGNPKTLSDIHVYDTEKRKWYNSFNCEDPARQNPRQWHTSTYVPERQILICFGGESMNPKTQKVTTTAKVMVLDTEIMLWYPPVVSGAVPSGRSGHTATLMPNTNELVVFGGVRGSKWLNSVSVLNTTTWVWSTPDISGTSPKPRSYHTATFIGGAGGKAPSQEPAGEDVMNSRIVIFGGNDQLNSFDTVHVLETDGTAWRWAQPSLTGPAPPARTGHSAILLSDKKTICIYGGWDPNADDDDDEMNDNNDEKKEDSDEDMIFGDSYLLDTETWTWSSGPKTVPVPADLISSECQGANAGAKRVGHATMLCPPSDDGTQQKALIFGGRTPNDDIFAGDFQLLEFP